VYLNHHFSNQWIGSAGPICCLARSPVITPCMSFRVGYVKRSVNGTLVADVKDLKNGIEAAVALTDVDVLLHT